MFHEQDKLSKHCSKANLDKLPKSVVWFPYGLHMINNG
jgi:hypothetical protein